MSEKANPIPTTEEGGKKFQSTPAGGIFVETDRRGLAPKRGAICFLRSGQIVQLKDLVQSGTGDIAPRLGASPRRGWFYKYATPLGCASQQPVSTNIPPSLGWTGIFPT